MKPMNQAVSALLEYRGQFFIAIRSEQLQAFAGYTSLPGGMVQENESLHEALIREVKEELNFDLKDQVIDQAIDQTPLAIMSSPWFQRLKVANHIFHIQLSHLPSQPSLSLNSELSSGQWASLEQILEQWSLGQRLIIPALLRLLRFLNDEIKKGILPKAMGELNSAPPQHMPNIEMIHGVKQILVLSPTLPPQTHTNSFIIGDVLIDPAPISGRELELLSRIVVEEKIKKIFLTHTHQDHCHFIDQWGPGWNLPIYLSEYCIEELAKLRPQKKFAELPLHPIKNGQELTSWLGHPVLVEEVPGHHAGQLALFPQVAKGERPMWFIASDLFQSEGSVVIGDVEGDLDLYLESLQKVITLNPIFLYPGHGMAVGGSKVLKNLIEHRHRRHQDIQMHLKAGLDEEQILERMYALVDKKLWPLARMNIRAHMRSLAKKHLNS